MAGHLGGDMWVTQPRTVLHSRDSRGCPLFCTSWKALSSRARTHGSPGDGSAAGSSIGREEVQATSFPIPPWPILADETLVPVALGLPETVQPLIGGAPIEGHRCPFPCTQQDLLVPKVPSDCNCHVPPKWPSPLNHCVLGGAWPCWMPYNGVVSLGTSGASGTTV